MQLQHLMTGRWREVRQLGVARIGHHHHAEAIRASDAHRFKQSGPLGRFQPARRLGHSDHTDGIRPKGRHRCRLGRLTQPADLQQHPKRP
jgi:hypothetical protein